MRPRRTGEAGGQHEADEHARASHPRDDGRHEDEQPDDEEDVAERAVRAEDVVEPGVRRPVLHAEHAEAGEKELDDHPEGEDGEDYAVDRAH